MLKRKRPTGSSADQTKYYAVRTGLNPGVYKTYKECLFQVTGFKKAEFKSFFTEAEALQYISGKDPSSDPNNPSYVPKYYGVRSGGTPGVYTSWEECQPHVIGVKNPKFKQFSTREEAEAFVRGVGADLPGHHHRGGDGHGHSGAGGANMAHGGHMQHLPHMQYGSSSATTTTIDGKDERDESMDGDAREDDEARNTRRKTSTGGSGVPGGGGGMSGSRRSSAIESILADEDGDDLDSDLREAGLLDDSKDGGDGVLDENILEDVDAVTSSKKISPKVMRNVLVPKKTAVLKIYTDGSSLMNGSAAARAGVGIWFGPGDKRNLSEPLNDPKATNNRAELSAILRAIQIAPIHREILIFTDSQYAIKCVTEWFPKWASNGWKTASGKPVENQDLIEEILGRIKERIVQGGAQTKFEWVNGHRGVQGNEMADKLAREGAVRDGVGRF